MKCYKRISFLIFYLFSLLLTGQTPSIDFSNPILPGFNPDPSICRVGNDYYMVTSSFTWFPAMPVYHSTDLVNWQLIGHGIERPGLINMDALNDNDGIWAVTIRYHQGVFYMITTANKCGGNFYITAIDPRGPWSEPVWLKDAPGIDPSLFWDDDGRCYYTGNTWDFKKSWPSQCAVWMQEIDLTQGKLVGERKTLTYGHANNATFAEGPHLYKINGKYLLLMSEGGAQYYHSITAHHSNSLWGPYVADKVNPVLTHRHLGANHPIQNIGHGDLVQTQKGKWHAVVLGVRNIDGYIPLARETFLCDVDFENGAPIFNPGKGMVVLEQKRPDLPWAPFADEPVRERFDSPFLTSGWYSVRNSPANVCSIDNGRLVLDLQSEVIDSLVGSAMLIRKIKHHRFTATTKMNFLPRNNNEEAGLVVYRSANGYYTLMKTKKSIVLTRKHMGIKSVIEVLPYNNSDVYFEVSANGLDVAFRFGESPETMQAIGSGLKLDVISDNKFNKFNGPGIGMYATSNGMKTKAKAFFDWFEYK
ncbi:MAG: glycoside hydrolase family 43 protein [Bacteroidales bacterium]|nr:glycoside hydrolase family 43 protein [Bacteroidales bacterium]